MPTVPRRPLAGAPPAMARRNFLTRLVTVVTGGALVLRARDSAASVQSADPYIGELALFAFNFAPTGWAQCNGQLLPISQNTALFSLLGTTYGGDGIQTFALPDLRGRLPLNQGQGPGLSLYTIGQSGGTETVALNASQMPAHTHALMANSGNGTSDTPTGDYLARNPAGIPTYATSANASLAAGAIAPSGSGVGHPNMPPFLTMNWCISLVGIYPSRP